MSIDSLKRLLPQKRDTARVNLLYGIAWAYISYQTDSSNNYRLQAYNEAEALQYCVGMAESFHVLSCIEINLGHGKEAKEYALQCLQTVKKCNDVEALANAYYRVGEISIYMNINQPNESAFGLACFDTAETIYEKIKIEGPTQSVFEKLHVEDPLARTYNLKGRAYGNLNKMYESFKFYHLSVQRNKHTGDPAQYSEALVAIGRIYFVLKEYSTALSYWKQSLAVGAPLTNTTFFNYQRIGESYYSLKKLDSALHYFDSAIHVINLTINDPALKRRRLDDALSLKAGVYFSKGEYNKAYSLWQPIFEEYRRKKDTMGLVMMLPKLGSIYENWKDYATAMQYGRQTIQFADQINTNRNREAAYALLVRVYDTLHRSDSAYYYFTLLSAIKDPIAEANLNNNLIFYKAVLQTESDENKIELLNKDNQLKQQELNLYKATLENEAAQSKIALLNKDNLLLNKDNQILNKDNQLKQQKLNLYKASLENGASQSRIALLNKDNQLLSKVNQLKQQKLNLIIVSAIGLFLLCLVFVRYLHVKRKNEAHRRALLENELQIAKLEYEKKQASLQQYATELEMQALRAQMNPHFIFNCLNAINHFILKNVTETASDYLTKFSRLIRLVLQNSSKKNISLADEIATLQLYMELEQVRFKNRFHFSISVNEDIDTEGVTIPPMLLQPFIENAIWHGLMQKEEQGELTIKIHQDKETLYCTITDNGVGRQNVAARKKPLAGKKSMGMQITSSRLKMLVGEKGTGDFTIIDLKDEEGNNNGTKVIVTIPATAAETVAA